MVAALDSKSSLVRGGSSSLPSGTKKRSFCDGEKCEAFRGRLEQFDGLQVQQNLSANWCLEKIILTKIIFSKESLPSGTLNKLKGSEK